MFAAYISAGRQDGERRRGGKLPVRGPLFLFRRTSAECVLQSVEREHRTANPARKTPDSGQGTKVSEFPGEGRALGREPVDEGLPKPRDGVHVLSAHDGGKHGCRGLGYRTPAAVEGHFGKAAVLDARPDAHRVTAEPVVGVPSGGGGLEGAAIAGPPEVIPDDGLV